MYCSKCGHANDDAAHFCVKCGAAASQSPAFAASYPATGKRTVEKRYAEGKTPWLALMLSLLIVGIGQFYNGDAKKGALMLVGAVISGALSYGALWFAFSVWAAVDAYRVATRKAPLWN